MQRLLFLNQNFFVFVFSVFRRQWENENLEKFSVIFSDINIDCCYINRNIYWVDIYGI